MRKGDLGGVGQPVEFLVDEDLSSRSVVAALRAAGMRVHTVPELFGKGCLDVDWLPAAGERGLVVLTKDKAMQRTPLEIAADACFRCTTSSHSRPLASAAPRA